MMNHRENVENFADFSPSGWEEIMQIGQQKFVQLFTQNGEQWGKKTVQLHLLIIFTGEWRDAGEGNSEMARCLDDFCIAKIGQQRGEGKRLAEEVFVRAWPFQIIFTILPIPRPKMNPTKYDWVEEEECVCENELKCFRPEKWMEPRHCVHASIRNVVKFLANGCQPMECPEILPQPNFSQPLECPEPHCPNFSQPLECPEKLNLTQFCPEILPQPNFSQPHCSEPQGFSHADLLYVYILQVLIILLLVSGGKCISQTFSYSDLDHLDFLEAVAGRTRTQNAHSSRAVASPN